jgi:hypothetical protein
MLIIRVIRAVPKNSEARLWEWKEAGDKIKTYFFFKRAMFYLYFLKDKYKVPHICGTSKGENDYRIHEEPPPNT